MMSKTVVLILPSDDAWRHSETQSISSRMIFEQMLNNGWSGEIIDARFAGFSAYDTAEKCIKIQPDFVIIEFLVRFFPFLESLFGNFIKLSLDHTPKFFLIGHAVTNYTEQISTYLPQVDMIFNDYDEESFFAYLHTMQKLNTRLKNPPIDSCKNNLKFLNEDDLKEYKNALTFENRLAGAKRFVMPRISRDYVMSMTKCLNLEVLSSFSCPGHCSFCNNHDLRLPSKDGWRGYSAYSVVEELKYLYYEKHHTSIQFVDHDFIGGQEGYRRAHDIAEGIISAGMNLVFSIFCRMDYLDQDLLQHLKKAGLFCINAGVESLSPRLLQRYNKGIDIDLVYSVTELIQKEGIVFNPSFILFDPQASLRELMLTFDYIDKYKLHTSFSPTEIIPVPNTLLHEQLRRERLIEEVEGMLSKYKCVAQLKYDDSEIKVIRNAWNEYRRLINLNFTELLTTIDIILDDWLMSNGRVFEKKIETSSIVKQIEFADVRNMVNFAQCGDAIPVEKIVEQREKDFEHYEKFLRLK